MARRPNALREFLRTEAAGGSLLFGAAVVALVWVNTPAGGAYHDLWATSVGPFDLHEWVNEGLMTLFFLVVGLEITRELTSGHLSSRRAAALPVVAAVAGMAVPALLYLSIAGGTAARGWGIPMATDIALAVGVLALAGSGAPPGLRAFLLGLAVVDDIGAIVVIAVCYSDGVRVAWLAVALAAIGAAVVARRLRLPPAVLYLGPGVLLWVALREAGVHATIAGVVMGLLTPVDRLERVEHRLHPFTSFAIVPLFALANSGVEVGAHALRDAATSPITWGIVVGLVVGKPLGVLLASALAIRSGAAERPAGVTARQLLGAGNAAGIGFTVALFIAQLALDAEQVDEAKLAILLASLTSGLLAALVLRQSRGSTVSGSTVSGSTVSMSADIAAAPTAVE